MSARGAEVRCTNCKTEVPHGQKFCGECGTRLSMLCSACGRENPGGQKFCGECGARLAAPSPPASEDALAAPRQGLAEDPPPSPAGATTGPARLAIRDAAPVAYTPRHLVDKILGSRSAFEGERKQVTVMFADVSGFTAMSSRLDPEEVHDIMDRAFDVILDAVHRYEGTVNQFLGDGVMALFGAPIAHEDHAHRALRASLAIQDGLSELKRDVRARHGVKFRIRMGINTGLVVVGAIGRDLRMDYTALGDTTNLAARLLGIAKPGQIVVSEKTHLPADGFFVFEDLGEFMVKGKDEPVRAWLLARELPGRTRLDISRERGLTPLVGRQGELARLLAAHQRALTGQRAVVVVAGEPGSGKSRLLYELLHRLESPELLEIEATCVSHGRALPYHPIVDLVRRLLGLADGAGPDDVRAGAAARLAALGISEEEPVALLANFLGVHAPPELLARLGGAGLRQRTHAVLGELLLRTADTRPMAIVVENLHWADASSEAFLGELVERLPGRRVLLLLSTRPGLTAPWLDSPAVEKVDLEGLAPTETREIARGILGVESLAPELAQTIVERSDGNPLYIEELLRQLHETAGVSVDAGVARLNAQDVVVPKSVHDIIAARIDRLADPVRDALRVAAVIGREFSVRLLARILGTDGELAGYLRDLRALDLVFPVDASPGSSYSFKHALIQEVAYGSLLERHRRRYHALVGHALEEFYAGRTSEVIGLLAHHFWRSGEDERAVDYAILAGEAAQRRWAQAEAIAHFDGALKRLGKMPDGSENRRRRIDAVVKQSEIKFAIGRHSEQVQALEAIREIVEASADAPRRAAWHCWAGFLHSLTGARAEVSIGYCEEATRIANEEGLDEIRAIAECCLTHVFVVVGRLRAALAAGERALEAFERRGNVWWACRTLWGLSMAANAAGEWEQSLGFCRRALDHGREVGDLRLRVVGWWRTGSTHVQRGAPDAGLRCCDEALALSPTPFDAAMVRAIRGYGLIRGGDPLAGTKAVAETLAWLEQSHLPYTRSVIGTLLAEGHIRLGAAAAARTLAEEIRVSSREGGHRHIEGVAERLLGETAADPAIADAHLARAAAIAEEVGAQNELARALAARARRQLGRGDIGAGRAGLAGALAMFEKLGTLDEIARARQTLAALEPVPEGTAAPLSGHGG